MVNWFSKTLLFKSALSASLCPNNHVRLYSQPSFLFVLRTLLRSACQSQHLTTITFRGSSDLKTVISGCPTDRPIWIHTLYCLNPPQVLSPGLNRVWAFWRCKFLETSQPQSVVSTGKSMRPWRTLHASDLVKNKWLVQRQNKHSKWITVVVQ